MPPPLDLEEETETVSPMTMPMNKEVTPFSEILKQMPHLKDVNKILDPKAYQNAKFYIIKSYNEENIFKVYSTLHNS